MLPFPNIPINSYEKGTKKAIKGDSKEQVSAKNHAYCKNVSDFCNRTTQFNSLTRLTVEKSNDRVVFKKLNPSLLLAGYESTTSKSTTTLFLT